jgi:hypothetical protein
MRATGRPPSCSRWSPCSSRTGRRSPPAEQERVDLDVGGARTTRPTTTALRTKRTASNDDVLDAFLKPFEGDQMLGVVWRRRADHRDQRGAPARLPRAWATGGAYGGLRRFVNDALAGGEPPEGALLVNLNLRAVTAGGAESLVERQLKQLLQPALWAPCARARCASPARCSTTPTHCEIRTQGLRFGNGCAGYSRLSTFAAALTSRCGTCALRCPGCSSGTMAATT